MGRSFRVYLAGETVYVCRGCGNHLAVQESVMSRVSQGTEFGDSVMGSVANRTIAFRFMSPPLPVTTNLSAELRAKQHADSRISRDSMAGLTSASMCTFTFLHPHHRCPAWQPPPAPIGDVQAGQQARS